MLRAHDRSVSTVDVPRSPRARRRRMRARILWALACLGAAQPATAQLVTYTWHNGQNTAVCGPLGSGNVATHNFAAPVETHDAIAFADPGGPTYTPSAAASQLDAVPAPNGIALAGRGSAQRGPLVVHATWATSDTRDHWEFTVGAPARFTFSASLSASSTEPTVDAQVFEFWAVSGGAQIVPDPGSPLPPYQGILTVPGSLVFGATGTLAPGKYYVRLSGRTDATTFPYSGSFDNSLALALDCATATSYCTSGTTTNGCNAQILASGTPSASASSGFTLDVVGVEGGSQGLIFYGTAGRSAAPWGTTSSFLCVKAPTQRTGAQPAGGTPGACDGVLTLDWNQFVSSHPSALGAPFTAGEIVQAQGWFRDPPSPKTTMLSDAVEFVVCP